MNKKHLSRVVALPGATVRWRGKLAVHAPEGTPNDPDQLSYIHDQVEAQLQAKSYRLATDGQPATYVLQGDSFALPT